MTEREPGQEPVRHRQGRFLRAEEQPKTLAEAHEVLLKRRPPYDAEPSLWARFHRHSAEVYAHIAKVDARHRHEAAQWAAAELRQARDLEDDPPPRRDPARRTTAGA